VVGYDDGQGCWIAKNSWGTGFGESGFFRIAYGQVGFDAEMWAIDGVAETGWQNGKKVVGLWTIDQDRNAFAYIDGLGWRKVAPDNDNIFFDLLTLLATAKAGDRPVNIYQDNGVIRQVYVL
jgi:C1A family cysteine protease